MPGASQDEQFKFLISCIRHSNNGRVDFAEVAKECQIVSKGAAAKRYERMMKYHGLYQPASGARETFKLADAKEPKSPVPATPIKKAAENPAKSYSSPKKRARKSFKGFDGESCNIAMDDDEELVPIGAGRIKTENEAPSIVKDEPEAGYHGVTGFQYPLSEEGAGTTGEEGADLLSDFLQPEDFEPRNGSDGNVFDSLGHGFPKMERGLSGI